MTAKQHHDNRPGRSRAAHAVFTLLAAALLAGGCSGSGSGAAGQGEGAFDGAAAPPAVMAPMPGTPAAGGAWFAGGSMADNFPIADQDQGREIITTGSANLISEDPIAAASVVTAIVENAGGIVESRSEWRGDEMRNEASAWLRLRVPAGEMTATLNALGTIGTLESVNIDRQDVTTTGRDLDARIAALETSTARLTELMATAGDVGDLLSVERELSNRQAELDGLRAQRTSLTDRVAMSTIELSIRTTPIEPVRAAIGWTGGFAMGWRAFVSFLHGLVIAVTAALPWLIIGAVIAAIVRPLWRRRRARLATKSGWQNREPADTIAPISQ